MSESASNIAYLFVAAIFLAVALWKGLALRREPTPTFALMTTCFAVGGIVYCVASPAGYRRVGEAVGHPWFPTLPIYLGILLCFGTIHLLTILWTASHPEEPGRVRRTIAVWAFTYGLALVIMTVAFFSADLEGPADPLKFNTEQIDEPAIVVFLAVFLVTLTSGTVNTWRRSRRARLDDEVLTHALRWFGGSMLVTFGYVVCSAPAIAAATMGHHQLDRLGVLGSTFGALGSLGTAYGVSGAAVSKWLSERRDIAVLTPLWDLVVAGVDEELSLGSARERPRDVNEEQSAGPERAKPNRFFNVRWTLHRMLIEILDGIRELERNAWVSETPAQAVVALHEKALADDALRSRFGLTKAKAVPALARLHAMKTRALARLGYAKQAQSPLDAALKGVSPLELEAMSTAAVLRDAVERLQIARKEESDRTSGAAATRSEHKVPGQRTSAANERARLVRVARALRHPLVDASLQAAKATREADGACHGAVGAR